MLVMKFGGTSVGSAERMKEALALSKRALQAGKAPVVVLSAMSGVTNLLIAGAEQALARNRPAAQQTIKTIVEKHDQAINLLLGDGKEADLVREQIAPYLEELEVLYKGISYLGELSKRSLDAVSGIGELLSTRVVAAYANHCAVSSVWVDARTFMITDDAFGRANPLQFEMEERARKLLLPALKEKKIVFTQGFIGATVDGVSTTLGRGGSDYSASIIGAALNAEEIQIWTDVDGMLSADPRVVPDARLLSEVSFQEASELAYFGAKVLHPLTIKPAVEKNIPVRILNTFNPDAKGTLITANAKALGTIRAVAAKKDITALFLNSPRMLMTHGFLAQVFQVFDKHKVPIDLIATSEVSVALTIDSKDTAEPLLRDLGEFGELQTLDEVAIVSVVGRQFREQSGIAGRVFKALSDINIIVISGGASDININFVVSNTDADKAVRQLHSEFFSAAAL